MTKIDKLSKSLKEKYYLLQIIMINNHLIVLRKNKKKTK